MRSCRLATSTLTPRVFVNGRSSLILILGLYQLIPVTVDWCHVPRHQSWSEGYLSRVREGLRHLTPADAGLFLFPNKNKKRGRLDKFFSICTIGNYFSNSDAISLGTSPRMSGTGEQSEAAWPDRSCFGWSEK